MDSQAAHSSSEGPIKGTLWQQESEISGINLKNGYNTTLKKTILGDTVIKIWFMLVLMSVPNAPSVKYNGIIYPTEEECAVAQVEFLNMYEAQPQNYKDKLVDLSNVRINLKSNK